METLLFFLGLYQKKAFVVRLQMLSNIHWIQECVLRTYISFGNEREKIMQLNKKKINKKFNPVIISDKEEISSAWRCLGRERKKQK